MPPLVSDVDADVAIVGGGFTGLWTALELKRASPATRVVLLEAARCGDGASGRNGGFLHGYWASLPRLVELFGREKPWRSRRSRQASTTRCVRSGRRLADQGTGMLTVAIGPAHDAELEHAAAVAAEVGAPEEAVLIERESLSVDSPAFRRAVFYRDAATVQPARSCGRSAAGARGRRPDPRAHAGARRRRLGVRCARAQCEPRRS